MIAVTVKYGGIFNTYRLKWIVDLRVDLNDSQVNCLILVKPDLKEKDNVDNLFSFNKLKLQSAHNRMSLCKQSSVGHLSAYSCNVLHGAMMENRFYEVSVS